MDDEQNNELIVVDQIREMPTKPDKVPIDQQAKNLIVSGAKCVPGAGNILGEMASQVLKVGEYSPEQRLRNLQFGWLLEVLPPILERIERLIDEGVHVESPDIGAIFEAALDASRKTTGKKRKYLKNALENAFSLKVYEEGQVLRFFKMLGMLEYGDIFALEWHVKNRTSNYGQITIGSKEDSSSNTMRNRTFHENRDIEVKNRPELLKKEKGEYHYIIPFKPYLPDAIWNNLDFHCLNLMEAGLLYSTDKPWTWGVRSVAEEFIWFVTADDEDLEEYTDE